MDHRTHTRRQGTTAELLLYSYKNPFTYHHLRKPITLGGLQITKLINTQFIYAPVASSLSSLPAQDKSMEKPPDIRHIPNGIRVCNPTAWPVPNCGRVTARLQIITIVQAQYLELVLFSFPFPRYIVYVPNIIPY
jgi:hypothetical protein